MNILRSRIRADNTIVVLIYDILAYVQENLLTLPIFIGLYSTADNISDYRWIDQTPFDFDRWCTGINYLIQN
jgi:hypothetical protein